MKTQQKSKAQSGQIRIIGGDWRGRKLPVLTADGLRPTGDRMRETLFNWLAFDIAGARCLDLFAGTGSLGFEALSRGAKQLVFVEKSPAVAKQLQQNIQLLNCAAAQVVNQDSQVWLAQTANQQFDVVFIDPPFFQNLVENSVNLLHNQAWLRAGWVYIEQEKSLEWPAMPANWQLHREKTSAQTRIGLWRVSEN